MPRRQRLAAYVAMLAFGLPSLLIALVGGEAWPFLDYRMYADSKPTPEVDWLELVGRAPDGNAVRLDDEGYIVPFAYSELLRSLYSLDVLGELDPTPARRALTGVAERLRSATPPWRTRRTAATPHRGLPGALDGPAGRRQFRQPRFPHPPAIRFPACNHAMSLFAAIWEHLLVRARHAVAAGTLPRRLLCVPSTPCFSPAPTCGGTRCSRPSFISPAASSPGCPYLCRTGRSWDGWLRRSRSASSSQPWA